MVFSSLSTRTIGERQVLLAVLIPVVAVVAHYVVLRRLCGTGRAPTQDASSARRSEDEDYSKYDTSNIRVTKILVHPIKSCKGTSVPEAAYTLEGLENDRKWCVIRSDTHAVVTAREVSKIVLVDPRIVADHLEVSFPEDSGCETFALPLRPSQETLCAWKSVDLELWGQKGIQGYICETTTGRSPSEILSEFPKLDAPSYFQDGYPLLLVSEETVEAVQERVRDMVGTQGVDDKWAEEEVKVERFRPNIVFRGAGVPFVEDVMTEVRISSDKEAGVDGTRGVIQLVSKCTRCLLPNVDPTTGVRDNAVPYKAIMKFRRGLDPARANLPCVGCNGILTGSGVVRVGDWVQVRQMGFV